jgi:hypothetical protein
LYKHQSETKNTKKRQKNELRVKIDNIKEEVTHDMENLRKKNETEIQNKVERHTSRQEQRTESQNSKMKWYLKEKLKNY